MTTLMPPTLIGNDPCLSAGGAAPATGAAPGRARRAEIQARLMTSEVGPDHAERLRLATESALATFKPANVWEEGVVGQIATLQVRISHTQETERRLRDWAAYRSIDFWADDQRVQVEKLATQFARHPARTVARFRQTPAGCDWLIERWATLARVDVADWTEDHQLLASRLLGITPGLLGTLDVTPARQLALLQAQRTRVAEADAITRSLVEASLTDNLGPDFARLQRSERNLLARLRFLLTHLPPRTPSLPLHQILTPPPAPMDETKPLPHQVDETKPPLSPPADADEETTELVPAAPVASRVDPGQAAVRRARLDLQKARKRERQARRRRA